MDLEMIILVKKKQIHLYDERFEDDLGILIKQLKCYKDAGFDYACLFLHDSRYKGPLASFIKQYNDRYKWFILR